MRYCRFCENTLGSVDDKTCPHCGIHAPYPDHMVDFYMRVAKRFMKVGTVLGAGLAAALWFGTGSLLGTVLAIPLGTLLGISFARWYNARYDEAARIFAFHRLQPTAYRMSGEDIALRLDVGALDPGPPKTRRDIRRIARRVESLKDRRALCKDRPSWEPLE